MTVSIRVLSVFGSSRRSDKISGPARPRMRLSLVISSLKSTVWVHPGSLQAMLYWHKEAWLLRVARNFRTPVPGDCVILFNFIQWTRVLSYWTANLRIVARRSFSVMVEVSALVSRMMSARRSWLQQWKRAVGIILFAMIMPTLYIFHCLVKADHRSGSQPRPIFGGSSFNFDVGWEAEVCVHSCNAKDPTRPLAILPSSRKA